MSDTHAASSTRSSKSGIAGAGWLETVRPTHAGAAVLLAVLAIGLVVEPGGPPAVSEAIEPVPLPEIPGGRAARVQPAVAADRVPVAVPGAGQASEAAGASEASEASGAAENAENAAKVAAGAAAVEPALLIAPEEIALGSLDVGQTATRVLTITNRGRSAVSILGVRTTCGCTAADPAADRLAPGDSTTLEVRFEAKNAGRQTQFVRLVTDDPAGPIMSVRLMATVTGGGG